MCDPQVGRQEPVMVLRVDKEKGYIDLSKRRVAAEDIQVSPQQGQLHTVLHKMMQQPCAVCQYLHRLSLVSYKLCTHPLRWLCCPLHHRTPYPVQAAEEKYNKSKMVHSIMRHVAETTGQDLEQLYAQIGWPLYKLYGHAFEAFKQMVQDPEPIFARLQVQTSSTPATWLHPNAWILSSRNGNKAVGTMLATSL